MFRDLKYLRKRHWIQMFLFVGSMCAFVVGLAGIRPDHMISATLLTLGFFVAITVSMNLAYEAGHMLGWLDYGDELRPRRTRSGPDKAARFRGVSPSDAPLAPQPTHTVGATLDGKLAQLVAATQERFWNRARGFDPGNRETFNSQDAIIEWIKEQQPGISQAKATAVEAVACPIER